MEITIGPASVMMAAYFPLLYGGAAFVRDKRRFSPAPREVRQAIPERKERFPGAHATGRILIAAAFLILPGAGRSQARLRLHPVSRRTPCDALLPGSFRYPLLRPGASASSGLLSPV